MRFISTIHFAKTVFSVFLVIWLIILVMITLNSVLSCVDKNGCLRYHCVYSKFNNEYQNVLLNYQIKCKNDGNLLAFRNNY
jgi:hypothetical protein